MLSIIPVNAKKKRNLKPAEHNTRGDRRAAGESSLHNWLSLQREVTRAFQQPTHPPVKRDANTFLETKHILIENKIQNNSFQKTEIFNPFPTN